MQHLRPLYSWLVHFGLVVTLAACGFNDRSQTATPPSPPIVKPTAAPAATSTVAPSAEPTATANLPPAPAVSESALLPETVAALNDYLTSVYDGEPFRGTVLVARNGEVLLRQGVGIANDEEGTLNGPETKFRLGSLTKPFTAAAVLMLYDQGLLDIDETFCTYLASCPPAWQAITVHDLLAHTSGITDVTMLPDYAQFKTEATTPAQTMARIADLPLDFAPGERWQYSNSNYIVLSAIIEQVSGQSYEAFVEERIFAPLAMSNSGYDHNDGETAVGYTPDGSVAEFIDMSLPDGAGALYSTVDDLYRFDRALYTEQLLPQALVERMFTPQAVIAPNDPNTSYGYGWIVLADADGPPPGKAVAHNGSIEGFSTAMVRFLELDAVVIVLGNVERRNPTFVAQGLAQRIIFD